MKPATLAALVGALACLVATPARADWDQTHWGDPIETVMATVGQGIHAEPGDDGDAVFGQDRAAERVGDFEGVAVRYQFYVDPRSRGLSLVRIQPLDEGKDCPAMAEAVRARYGKPGQDGRKVVSGTNFDRSEWADRKANLTMLLSEFSGVLFNQPSCLFIWQPYGSGKPGPTN